MTSLGEEALAAGLCSHVACFEYADARAAKRAWERAAALTKRPEVRGVSINRVLDPARPTVQLVIVLGEDADRVEPVAAVLARGGRRVTPSKLVLEATAAKRAHLLAGGPGQRIVTRYPSGQVIDADGESHGPLRRPQG